MDIERLPADERAWRGWHTVWCDGIASDKPDQPPPTWQATRAGLRKPWPGQISEHWVAREGHQIIGAAEIKFPQLDNKDNAWLELMVHPEHRRRGVGSALLARAVERVREDSRKRLMADAVQARPGGEERSGAPAAFAAKHGAKPALEEVRQRLTLPDGPLAGMDDTLADAWRHAGGYSLIRWTEAGAPDDIVAGIAALDSDFLNQAPMGELEWEAELIDVAMAREIEQAIRDRGWERNHTAARHDASGEVVAWTAIGTDPASSHHAYQQITLVRPDHRGHRLGTVIKWENLAHARARYPALRHIDTWNASVNQHMIAINELMGFRPVDLGVNWQLEL